MSGFHRLPGSAPARFGSAIDRGEPVGFRFDGRLLPALYGDTLASALLANGRAGFGRGPLLGRARGLTALGLDEPFAWAIPEDGSEPLRADDIAAVEGGSATAVPSGAAPSRLFARAAADGPVAGAFPPGRRLLARLRRHAALPPAIAASLPPLVEAAEESCDALVVGAGLAGLAAAVTAQRSGLVVRVVEATGRVGGLADLYDGAIDGLAPQDWALQRAGELSGRDAAALALRAEALAIEPDGTALVSQRGAGPRPGPAKLRAIRAGAIILACGFHERPLLIAGADRPGVLLAGAARGLLRRYAVAPGDRVVVATTGDEGYRTAIDLAEAGVTVEMILDARAAPDSALVDRAKAHGLPLSLSSLATGVATADGSDRIVGVTACNVGGEGAAAGRRTLFADALVASDGLAPRRELADAAGLDEAQGLFVASRQADLASAVRDGVAAGAAAARHLGREAEAESWDVQGLPDAPEDAAARAAPRARLGESGDPADAAVIDAGADVTFGDLRQARLMGLSGPALRRWLGLGRGRDGGLAGSALADDVLGEAAPPSAPSPRLTLGALAARARLVENA
ncbi:hypothetical protein GCM10008171_12360 [Methylopila jiangsuensis]|uniref:FAD/NAD(P)-binding domain-containing protein n=1 Tax=Methylopila jiangsuensis TaxID=586230 RepID=A0A9W6JFA2_9HYPH|nr:FAD-dependent oxidoreductase [Methylopila jiangsuensis]MDR6286221.1 sarcosine oxidase subunit alpha [Methylopila jiangsuensis]GLK75982.1 hypothetical protein GCM10008171_12360 [Methylopila jiangsuensis]